MNISFGNFQKRIINPVWSSDHSHDATTSANVWPIRPQSHPRRFYSSPKVRKSYINVTQFSPQITPITMRVDIEQFNKHKSQSSMAFCSTSKVKYMPLQGLSPNDITPSKWCNSSSSVFPMLARPSSRPVILHGQRYTIMAIEDERSSTGISSNTKEEDKLSSKAEYVSEQRRRFNEAERNKCHTKVYRENTDSSEYRVMRNYCLSGHRMFIKSSRETVDERLCRLQPTLNLQNVLRKKEELLIEDTEEDQNTTASVPRDNTKEQMPNSEINDSIISVDIVSNTKEEKINENLCSRISDALKSAIENLESVKVQGKSVTQSKVVLTEMIESYREIDQHCIDNQDSDMRTIASLWTVLEPKIGEIRDDSDAISLFKNQIDSDASAEIDSITFLSKLFGDGTHDNSLSWWSKIFSVLQIRTVNATLFVNMTKLIRIFRQEGKLEEVLRDDVSLAKIYFWIQLFVVLLRVDESSFTDMLNYLRTISTILVNRNVLDEETAKSVELCLENHVITGSFIDKADVPAVTVPLGRLIETIPWIFSAYYGLFRRSLTLDDVATVLTTLTNDFAM